MKTIWFKQLGWMYMPVHFMGIVVTLSAIVFLVPVYMAVTRNGHSVSDDLYEMFVYTTCTAFWWKWIADKTSDKRNSSAPIKYVSLFQTHSLKIDQ